eukprot:6406171-Amphidinium_carterae.1
MTANIQLIKASAVPEIEVASGYVLVKGHVNTKRPKKLDFDSYRKEHYRDALDVIEKDACKASSS